MSNTLAATAARLVLCVLVIADIAWARPGYIGCADSSECGFGHCCVLGQGRFSIPHCTELGEIGSSCRPGYDTETVNITVYYPNQEEVELTNIHHLMCPCMAGLICSPQSGTCSDQYHSVSSNFIDD